MTMDTKTRGRTRDDTTLDLFVGGGGVGGAPPSPTAIGGDDYIDMAAFAERSYLT